MALKIMLFSLPAIVIYVHIYGHVGRRITVKLKMKVEQIIETIDRYVDELGQILGRFSKTRDGLLINSQDNYRMRQIAIELVDFVNDHIPDSAHHFSMVSNFYNEGISDFYGSSSYASVEEIRGVLKSIKTRIERNPALFDYKVGKIAVGSEDKKRFDGIEVITSRFHTVVMQLRKRHDNRATLDVTDEYDVQDLLHSLLKLYFNDIRPEEWVPSYAGGASRSDFLLPEINAVIEIKRSRQSMSTKDLGEQLIVDIAKYKMHPQCSRLICFVYDPEGRVNNPRGMENDLSNCDSDIDVRTIIVPKQL